jgi:short subunit dehydrogenase-like uncharacterized protein
MMKNVILSYILGYISKLIPVLLSFSIIATIVQWIVPVGSGPTQEQMELGSLEVDIIGFASCVEKPTCRASITYDKDPGYNGTSIILVQAALILINDPNSCEKGVGTVACVFGKALINEIEKKGFRFKVSSI